MNSTETLTITLSDAEARAVRAAAEQSNMSPEEWVRTYLVRGLQAGMGLAREGQEAGLADTEVAERFVRAFIAPLSNVTPEGLRLMANVYEKVARQMIGAGMDELRERIRREKGPIPDVAALIDEGRAAS